MRDSRETDQFTLTAALSFLCIHKNGAEAISSLLETTRLVNVIRSCTSYEESNSHPYYYKPSMPPLHIAVENDNLDTVRVLLQQATGTRKLHGSKQWKRRPINVNIECDYGDSTSPLVLATQKAIQTWRSADITTQLEIIQLLLQQQGIYARRTDRRGNTPLAIACYNGEIDVVHLLLDHDKSLVLSW
jgi:hypothetical protein